MGDCRIRILIAKEIIPSAAFTSDDDEWLVISHVASADSTVGDVYDATLKPLFTQNTLPENICLWDCTLYPPKDITEWLVEFGERMGRKSKTLFDAGWFPSGTWQVLPQGKQPSKTHNYDDVQYNLPSESSSTLASSSAVQLVGDHADNMTPSQVLQSVTQRFPETNPDEERKRALEVRKQKRKEQKEKEAKRHARLEERIRKLEDDSSKKSNKAVSKQVRRMLIKSRCTGSSSLKMHDRVYLHIVVVNGDDDTREEFRYFSQQDTVARIVSTVANNVSLPQEAELLVKCTGSGGEMVYRRLPVSMRLYEAIAANHVEEVDTVVIRCFTPPEEEPTTSITDTEEEEQSDTEMEIEHDTKEDTVKDEAEPSPVIDSMETDEDNEIYNRMATAISAMDDAASAKSKKKSSSTSDKVRKMLMKSKAKGDKKRVPKMDDRFFMELIVVEDFNGHCSAAASPVFLARSDAVERLLSDCVLVPNECTAEIYIPTEQGSFQVLSGDLSWQDAETRGLIKCFDRVVVRLFKE